MKIGFFGNTNNYPFTLATALRRLGHEVEFVVDRLEPLHRPEFKDHGIAFPYPAWIHDLSPTNGRDLVLQSGKRDRILQILRKCDAVVLNGLGPSLSHDIGRPAFVLLTGADLEHFGNINNIDYVIDTYSRNSKVLGNPILRPLLHLMIRRLIGKQRAGIRDAAAVSYFARGLVPSGDRILDDIGVRDERRIYSLMTDIERLDYVQPSTNQPVRVFCATRLTWKKPVAPGKIELDYKGSDVMVKGLGAFIRKTGTPLDIRLVRKGDHVSETEELVVKEGLADYVTWLDEMSQLEVLTQFREADIVFEQLDSSALGMAGVDAMAIGRPVIANAKPELVDRYFGEPSPICQARTPEEVCTQLDRLVPDPKERGRVGLLSREYAERVFSSEHAARVCVKRLAEHCS